MGRTYKVVLTAQAQVLRKLRLKHRYSMKKAGELLGYSDSYISQIENGRENVPKGERLLRFLKVYGDITEKYYKQLCKDHIDEETDKDVILALLSKMKPEQQKVVRVLCESLTAKLI